LSRIPALSDLVVDLLEVRAVADGAIALVRRSRFGGRRRGVGYGEWLAFLVLESRGRWDFCGVEEAGDFREGSALFRLRPPPAAYLRRGAEPDQS